MADDKTAPVCGRHKVAKEWRLTSFVYNDEGISVCVAGVYGWVCPESGEASFPPETADELITTVRLARSSFLKRDADV